MRGPLHPRCTEVLDPNRPVRVFKNWKLGCWNIMQDGLLRASARQVRLEQVRFVVRESGRQRALREGRRNVHAYAVGLLRGQVHADDADDLAAIEGREVVYDARHFASFVERDSGSAVIGAEVARFDEHGLTCLGLVEPPGLRAA